MNRKLSALEPLENAVHKMRHQSRVHSFGIIVEKEVSL